MELKKQIVVGILSAAIGLSLIGGGTFANGSLDLSVEPTE